jgi:hypothetical protein
MQSQNKTKTTSSCSRTNGPAPPAAAATRRLDMLPHTRLIAQSGTLCVALVDVTTADELLPISVDLRRWTNCLLARLLA